MRSASVYAGIGRTESPSKMAATVAPSCLICPRFMVSVFEVNGFEVAVEIERGRALFLGAKARVFGAAERQLVFHARAGKIDGQQAGFRAIDIFQSTRKIGR